MIIFVLSPYYHDARVHDLWVLIRLFLVDGRGPPPTALPLDTNMLGQPFLDAVLPIAPDFSIKFSLFHRQGCPVLTLLCPSGGCCAYDATCCGKTCCPSGYLCTGGTAAAPCCVAIGSSTNTCGSSNPCSRPGDLPCQGINICCPPNNSCYYDNNAIARCSPLGSLRSTTSSIASTSAPSTTTSSHSSTSSYSYSYPGSDSESTSYSYQYYYSTTSSSSRYIYPGDTNSSSSFSSSTNEAVSPGIIAGIAAGSLAGVVSIVLLVYCLLRRRRQRRRPIPRGPLPSYGGNSSTNPGGAGAVHGKIPFEIKNDNAVQSVSTEHVSNVKVSSYVGQHKEQVPLIVELEDDQSIEEEFDVDTLPDDFGGPLHAEHIPILYTPLAEGDIRVLEIMMPKKGKKNIVCKLWVHTIEPHSGIEITRHWSGYEALSYVWAQKPRDLATKHKKAVITVINSEMPNVRAPFVIGWNLSQALEFFRKENCSRILWTDQICINQKRGKGNKEKTLQMHMMTTIYQSATQVQVWLGLSFDESRRAAEHFAPLEGKSLEDSVLMQSYRTARQRWEDLFEGFQNRPWWTRAWIIQEVISSPNPILNSGADSLSFNLVLRLLGFAVNKRLALVTTKSKMDWTSSRFPLLEMIYMRGRLQSGNKPHLSEWLGQFHMQNATEPRDRIFAYLGLARDALPYPPQTTYDHSIEEVWTEGTKLALYMSDNLDFICLGRGWDHSVPGNRSGNLPGNPEDRDRKELLKRPLRLPGWVPNFRVNEGDGLLSGLMLPLRYDAQAKSPYNASGGLVYVPLINFSLPELEVFGALVDKIKYISEPNFASLDELSAGDFIHEAQKVFSKAVPSCAEHCSDKSCMHYPGPRGGSYPLAFYKTMVMDISFQGTRLKPEYGLNTLSDRINKPPDRFRPGETDPEIRRILWNRNVYEERSRWTSWRRFVVTERGYLGMVSFGSQVGDSIYIMVGATIPFVMRQTDELSSEGYKTLSFIGESYLHGFMDGEIVEEDMKGFETVVMV